MSKGNVEFENKNIEYYTPKSVVDMFDCVELPNAPEWDGHTADDALKRLLSLTKSNN